ncbi:unnamed protein product [Caenorhabditis auriculariae]|uniref:BTB domain-containing protein n=1 Tax=Caenorhabditis auriculariae TaxID=2777116 RepID=A0A8S1HIG9_9PELO|nr:unnamed protein product [Caenorhabditis auriculariae]
MKTFNSCCSFPLRVVPPNKYSPSTAPSRDSELPETRPAKSSKPPTAVGMRRDSPLDVTVCTNRPRHRGMLLRNSQERRWLAAKRRRDRSTAMLVRDLFACLNRDMLIIPVTELAISEFDVSVGDQDSDKQLEDPKELVFLTGDDQESKEEGFKMDEEILKEEETTSNAAFVLSNRRLSATKSWHTSPLFVVFLDVPLPEENISTTASFIRSGQREKTSNRVRNTEKPKMSCSATFREVDEAKKKLRKSESNSLFSLFSPPKIDGSLSSKSIDRISSEFFSPPAAGHLAKMATEVVTATPSEEFCFATTSIDRPFRLVVQKSTFLIDSKSMSAISPIFTAMCFGKDFDEKGMALSRDIVDEKSRDIDVFLRAVHDTTCINPQNFALVLRLSHKYQVMPVVEACEQFILQQDLDSIKAEDILTLLMAAHEHHCSKEVLVGLIRRLASEGNVVFTKLKISRFLNAQVYGAVISTSMNMAQIREHESMNGHHMKMDRSKTRWRAGICEICRGVTECANCEECRKYVCKRHVGELACPSDFGQKNIENLKKNLVDFDWND